LIDFTRFEELVIYCCYLPRVLHGGLQELFCDFQEALNYHARGRRPRRFIKAYKRASSLLWRMHPKASKKGFQESKGILEEC
jgi:hypothetical protein